MKIIYLEENPKFPSHPKIQILDNRHLYSLVEYFLNLWKAEVARQILLFQETFPQNLQFD